LTTLNCVGRERRSSLHVIDLTSKTEANKQGTKMVQTLSNKDFKSI